MKPYHFTKRADGLPSVAHDKGDAIRTAFFALAKRLSSPDPDKLRVRTWFLDKVPEVIPRPKYGSYRKWMCTALFDPEHAKLLGVLYTALREGMERAYLEGKADGSHLLSRLANGEITPGDFEDRREDRRKEWYD
jgi:hypothetical protein